MAINNIEKLYELAGIKKVGKKLSCSLLDFGACKNIKNCNFCDKAKLKEHQPFTDTKQLELIKWIAINGEVCRIDATEKDKWFIENDFKTSECFADFSQALAGLVCELWEDLTDTQREEIKRILE